MKLLLKTTTTVAVSMTAALGLLGTPAVAHDGEDHGQQDQTEVQVRSPRVVPPAEVPLDLAGDIVTNLIGGESTNGQYSVLDIFVPAQSGPPPHIHSQEDELFYILDGQVSMQLNEQTFTATPGTFAYLPKDQPHAFRNLTTEPARMLAFGTPAGFEHLVQSVAVPVTGTSPAPSADFSFIDQFLATASEYGVDFPDTLIFPFPTYSVNEDGTPTAEISVLRPGRIEGPASATITLSDGTSNNANTQIPVNFAEGQRLQTVTIPLNNDDQGEGNQTTALTLTDSRDNATSALLQNKALLTNVDNDAPLEGDSSNTLISVEELYDLPVVLVDPERETLQVGGENISFVATGEDTDGELSLFNLTLAPQAGLQPAIHGQADEAFYIVDGEVTFQLNGQTFTATPGTFVYAPKGDPYSLGNLGAMSARAVLVSAPSGLEDYFRNSDPTAVPEPSPTWGLLALGACGVVYRMKTKLKNRN